MSKYRESGATAEAYAAQVGINRGTLLWWHRKLKREEVSQDSGTSIELKLPEPESEYVIRFRTGHELCLKGSFSVSRVSELAKLLSGEPF